MKLVYVIILETYDQDGHPCDVLWSICATKERAEKLPKSYKTYSDYTSIAHELVIVQKAVLG